MISKIQDFINRLNSTKSFEHLGSIRTFKDLMLSNLEPLINDCEQLASLRLEDFNYLGDFQDKVEELADNISIDIEDLEQDYQFTLEQYQLAAEQGEQEEGDSIKINIIKELLDTLGRLR